MIFGGQVCVTAFGVNETIDLVRFVYVLIFLCHLFEILLPFSV